MSGIGSAERANLESANTDAERRIPLDKAGSFVGVSTETLLRFMEAGYFPGASKESGIAVEALESIFGVRIPAQFTRTSNANARVTTSEQSKVKVVETEKVASNTTTPETDQTAPIQPELVSASQSTFQVQPDPQVLSANSDIHDQPFASVPRRGLIDMYERLISKLEDEVKSLRSERDWLKTRVERNEEKSSRDQLLMLAETQTIRNLISLQEQARSPMRSALRWLGLLPAPMPEELNKKS